MAEPAGTIPASRTPSRPSTLIAQALVERQTAGQISARAAEMGLPRSMVRVIVAACGCGPSGTVAAR